MFFIVVKCTYHTVYHFNHVKMYNSRSLSTFYEKNFTKMMTSLYESCHYHHCYLVPIVLHHLKWKCYPHQAVVPHPSSAASLVRSNLSSVSGDVPVLTSHTNGLLHMWLFVSRSLHSTKCFKVYLWYVTCISISLLFVAFLLYGYTIFCLSIHWLWNLGK